MNDNNEGNPIILIRFVQSGNDHLKNEQSYLSAHMTLKISVNTSVLMMEIKNQFTIPAKW